MLLFMLLSSVPSRVVMLRITFVVLVTMLVIGWLLRGVFGSLNEARIEV